MSESKKIAKITVGIIGFLMILLAMNMIITPIISQIVAVDYGHPTTISWQVTKQDGKKADIRFDDDIVKSVQKYQREYLHLPFALSIWQLIKISLILGLVYIFLMGTAFQIIPDRNSNSENIDENQNIVFNIVFCAFAITLVIIIGLPVLWAILHDYKPALESTIYYGKSIAVAMPAADDAKLVEAALRLYHESLFAISFIAILVLILVTVVFGIIYVSVYVCFVRNLIRPGKKAVAKIVTNQIQKYEEKFFLQSLAKREDQVNNLSEKLGRDLGSNNELIEIMPNGTVEVVRYSFSVKWQPFPVIMPQREVITQISLENFYGYLVSPTKREALAELRDKLFTGFQQYFQAAGEKARADFVEDLARSANRVFDQKLPVAEKDQLGAVQNYTEKIILLAADKSLRKFKEELTEISTAEINDILNGLKNDLLKEVSSNVERLIRSGNANNEANGLMLLPPETRFYFSRNNCQLIVLEQPPMSRNIFYCRDRFTLAFPYVIFVMLFRDNHFDTLWVYYRNKPLQDVSDRLYLPNLNNIGERGDVCLRFNGHKASDFSSRVKEVITHFWNSQFNTDINDNYRYYSIRIPELKDYETWAKQSRKNPLFPLKIEWRETLNLERMLQSTIGGIHDDRGLREIQRSIETAFSESLDGMAEALKKRFSQIKVKGKYPEIIAQAVEERIAKIIKQLSLVLAGSFNQAKSDDTLVTNLQYSIESNAEKAMVEEFNQLAKDVLFRCRINSYQLLEDIKNGRRR